MNLLTIKDAGILAGLSENTVRNWIDEGKIQKYEDDKGRALVNKREILKTIPTIITFFNQKGGCGKTTSSVICADYFEKQGDKVLVVDLDQQGNISQTFFSFEELGESLTLYDYVENKTPVSKIVKKYSDNVDVIPADIRLSRKDYIDTSLLIQMKEDFIPVFKKYNIVILDCPPSLNAFSRMGALYSNYIFCPIVPEPYSHKGLAELLNSMKILTPFNKDFIDYRVFISTHRQHRTTIREDYVLQFKEQLGDKIFKNYIPDFIGVVERGVAFSNIFDMYKNDKSISKILELMKEIDNFIYEGRR
ncbi:MAG TPA: AAA family ATPase [Spirochaetota bacterium]|nr:AAA family ATPase [Spirochaetota bacterium]HOS32261.1 AAA family ATPase [Spirochaetota bacterium]HOS55672.1 AAA family ATPase [Spirochaetota bacterium]HPK61372.1 AAA family ATPase [Spirochaetota bacterium]HQF78079.1 AAA family ATPase [Spirochaetota bacterium]